MSVPWRRPDAVSQGPLGARQDEIDTAVQANHAARADAARTKARATRLSARVQRIHAVLMQEGADNHFTERWERAWGDDYE